MKKWNYYCIKITKFELMGIYSSFNNFSSNCPFNLLSCIVSYTYEFPLLELVSDPILLIKTFPNLFTVSTHNYKSILWPSYQNIVSIVQSIYWFIHILNFICIYPSIHIYVYNNIYIFLIIHLVIYQCFVFTTSAKVTFSLSRRASIWPEPLMLCCQNNWATVNYYNSFCF